MKRIIVCSQILQPLENNRGRIVLRTQIVRQPLDGRHGEIVGIHRQIVARQGQDGIVILFGEQQIGGLADDGLIDRFQGEGLPVTHQRGVGEAGQIVGVAREGGHGRDGIPGKDLPPERRAGGIIFHPESDLHLLDPVEQVIRSPQGEHLVRSGGRRVVSVLKMAVSQL